MTISINGVGASAPDKAKDIAIPQGLLDKLGKVQKSAKDMEGVFTTELFKAMRETVPEDGAIATGEGERMFTSMLDEKMATGVSGESGHWEHGTARGIFHQLARSIVAQSGVSAEVGAAAIQRVDEQAKTSSAGAHGKVKLGAAASRAAGELRTRLNM